jgi:hypothetical protein
MDTWKKPEVHAGMWWTDRRMNAPPAPGENVTSTSYLWDEVPTCTRVLRCEHGLRKEMRRHPASTPKIHFWLSFSLRQFYASPDGRTDRHCTSGSVLTFLPFSNEIWHFCPSTWMLNRTCDLCCIYCQKTDGLDAAWDSVTVSNSPTVTVSSHRHELASDRRTFSMTVMRNVHSNIRQKCYFTVN